MKQRLRATNPHPIVSGAAQTARRPRRNQFKGLDYPRRVVARKRQVFGGHLPGDNPVCVAWRSLQRCCAHPPEAGAAGSLLLVNPAEFHEALEHRPLPDRTCGSRPAHAEPRLRCDKQAFLSDRITKRSLLPGDGGFPGDNVRNWTCSRAWVSYNLTGTAAVINSNGVYLANPAPLREPARLWQKRPFWVDANTTCCGSG